MKLTIKKLLWPLLALAVVAGMAADVTLSPNTLVPQDGDSGTTLALRQGAALARINGGSTIATGQQTLSTSAAQVVDINTARRTIVIDNHDASIAIYVGVTGVTSSTGKLVRAGQAITLHTTAAIYAVAASGSPVISYLAEND